MGKFDYDISVLSEFGILSEVSITLIPNTREIPENIRGIYSEQGFDNLPEEKPVGGGSFNPNSSSFTGDMLVVDAPGKPLIKVNMQVTAKMVDKAYQIFVDRNADNLSIEQIRDGSPRMANVSAIVPLVLDDKLYFATFIKGTGRIGASEVHGSFAAGPVMAKYLKNERPLETTLIDKTKECMGIDLTDYLRPDHARVAVDESPLGFFNFASIIEGLSLELILSSYQTLLNKKVSEGKDLLKIPSIGVVLLPYDAKFDADRRIDNIFGYIPDEKGILSKKPVQIVNAIGRPYANALVKFTNENPSAYDFFRDIAAK